MELKSVEQGKQLESDELESKLEVGVQCHYTENLPQLLSALKISILGTSFQADKLFVVRSTGSSVDVNFKTFERPMGLAVGTQQITIGCQNQVIRFIRNDAVLDKCDDEFKPFRDACFLPSLVHYTGMINIHDVAYGNDGLWVTNSNFSCLATLETGYSFVPRWKPYFISKLAPEDKCHLNGMAMLDGHPAYVSCFRKADYEGAWRQNSNGGIIMDVEKNEVLVDGLIMPHSPRCYQNTLYFCESGKGIVWRYDLASGDMTKLITLPGYTRGMDFWGPFMFVGTSLARFSDISNPPPIYEDLSTTVCGVWVINIETAEIVGSIKFSSGIEQLYDVAVLGGVCFPEVVEPSSELSYDAFNLPM